jgi:hypothetical protein
LLTLNIHTFIIQLVVIFSLLVSKNAIPIEDIRVNASAVTTERCDVFTVPFS